MSRQARKGTMPFRAVATERQGLRGAPCLHGAVVPGRQNTTGPRAGQIGVDEVGRQRSSADPIPSSVDIGDQLRFQVGNPVLELQLALLEARQLQLIRARGP